MFDAARDPSLCELSLAGAYLGGGGSTTAWRPAVREARLLILTTDVPLLLRIIRPLIGDGRLPVVLYTHCGADGHEALMRKIASGADAAVVAVEYDPRRGDRHPAVLRQAVAAIRWVLNDGRAERLDGRRVAVAGDSPAANAAAAVAYLGWHHGAVRFTHQGAYGAAAAGGTEPAVALLRQEFGRPVLADQRVSLSRTRAESRQLRTGFPARRAVAAATRP